MTLQQNVKKECEEEASLPPEVVRAVRATGLVSYRCEGQPIRDVGAAPPLAMGSPPKL